MTHIQPKEWVKVIYQGFVGWEGPIRCLGGRIVEGRNEILKVGKALQFAAIFQKYPIKLKKYEKGNEKIWENTWKIRKEYIYLTIIRANFKFCLKFLLKNHNPNWIQGESPEFKFYFFRGVSRQVTLFNTLLLGLGAVLEAGLFILLKLFIPLLNRRNCCRKLVHSSRGVNSIAKERNRQNIRQEIYPSWLAKILKKFGF